MSYRSLMVHLDNSEHAQQRLELALRIARQFDAQLIGLYVTFTPDSRAFFVMAGTADYYTEHMRRREQRRGALERLFQAECARAKVTGHFLCSNGHGNRAATQQARVADLVIAGQTDPNDPESFIDDHFAEHLVMAAGRPVLFVPYAGVFPDVGRRILIAWDGSREAARAAYDALPFLSRAKQSTVVTVHGAASEAPGARIPGADIALALARHGADIDVLELEGWTDARVGDTLLTCAHEHGCDMIVMGAYGHARWQEAVMGGATRTVLQSMTVPVLMSR
ncbi:universal stress protein [Paraburkholderia rhizosphaerae]|uniref:Nucleotide-binding universal stress UspA family protein n=1 Tax=Paraburkholderia rhizosphaerae TaxID=480658 RepID=A0A4R8LTD8_9BURK|nr:universal stress protein [Paraburkholderia rhizosphaerae]TDY50969.1 nucleotide-binding universal stress UspA family protein [Paraburkholderia rhizosphaerae]